MSSIVVTGATKGIGRAIVDLFADEGFDVAFCARNAKDVDAFVASLQQRHPARRFMGRAVDVRDKAAVIAFGHAVVEAFGAPAVVVNNAGVFVPGTLAAEEDGAFEMIMETNVYSAYYLTRSLLPALVKAGAGHIINMGSVAGLKAYPTGGSYSVSKFALHGLSKGLREELKGTGLKVTALMPGAVWTDSWSGSGVAEERLMPAADIARIVLDLTRLSPNTVVEEMVIRPMLGDL